MSHALRQPLPIDPFLPEMVERLLHHPALVLEAPPGAGKTTRLPRALFEAGLAETGEIWVLEPRRLATRLAARRVAAELGEALGERVGYSIRFETIGGPRTRLRFVTEGVLLRRLTQTPNLKGVSAVILDEFHERHLETDVALASLLWLQRTCRPGLKLAVMSATMDAAAVAAHLQCPAFQVHGRSYPVEVEYHSSGDKRNLSSRIAEALRSLLNQGLQGDVLVFLPGVGEIVEAEEICKPLAAQMGVQFHRLHGSLESEQQDAVLMPGPKRKVILATNVAETSVTIEGITAVIDSGMVKEAGHSPWSGLPTLRTTWISQASAAQRAGRAGRLNPGRCLRLYARHEFQAMRPFTLPEIQRADLSSLLLTLEGSGLPRPQLLPWLQPPPDDALQAAEILLQRLHATDSQGRLTDLGRRMLGYPAHPRIARILCESADRHVLEAGAILAAILEHPDPRPERRWSGKRNEKQIEPRDHPSDPVQIAEEMTGSILHAETRHRILKVAQTYAAPSRNKPGLGKASLQDLLQALLCGFPDRVARRVRPGSNEVVLSSGGRAVLAPESNVRNAEFLVALEAREDPRRRGKIFISRASAIEPDWLLGLPGCPVAESREVLWNPDRERVEVKDRILYDQLVLDTQEIPAANCPEAGNTLASEALKAGLARFFGEEQVNNLLGRMAFIRSLLPDLRIPDEEQLADALKHACRGKSSFRELEGLNLNFIARSSCDREAFKALERLAPEEIPLPSGHRLRVSYSRQGQPLAKVRIQDLYGLKRSPCVGDGKVPVQLHLLAPNQRPAQITNDLGGFWAGSYERVRKELKSRFPKHYWPDDPASAPPVQLKRHLEKK